MGAIQYVRGINSSLPENKKDGTIYIIGDIDTLHGKIKESGYYHGDMYVDIDDDKRFHIKPYDAVYYGRPEDFGNLISEAGRVYALVTSDNPYTYTVNGQTKTVNLPTLVIGDGLTAINQLPHYVAMINDDDKDFWNKKINVNYSGETLDFSARDKYSTPFNNLR